MPVVSPYPGFGARVAGGMQALGYWYGPPKNRPDVLHFCRDHPHHMSQYMYAYLKDERLPVYENLMQLAKDLQMPAPVLMFGEEAVLKAAAWIEERRTEAARARRRR